MGGIGVVPALIAGGVGWLASKAVGFLGNLISDDSGAEKISHVPSYDAQNASIEQTRQLDQLLQQERERRKTQIEGFDQHMKKYGKTILDQIKQDIKQFERYGLQIDDALAEKQFAMLENSETLADLANRRYSIADAECREILEIEEGESKKHRMKEFGDNLLLEGGIEYYDKITDACDVVFAYIDNSVTRQTNIKRTEIEQYAADIANFSQEKDEQERQKSEKQAELQELESLETLFV